MITIGYINFLMIMMKGGDKMKISTKGIYALEVMIDLAMHSTSAVVSAKNISKRRNLSEKYLEQIIGLLRKGKIIKSKRGAGGGYSLIKDPNQITVKEILQLAERNLIPVECVQNAENVECQMNCELCAARLFWRGLWDRIEDVMEHVTLQMLVDETKKCEKTLSAGEIEYYI